MSDSEMRAEVRKDVSIRATMRSKDGLYSTSCMISDASKQGCQIVTCSTGEIPDTIFLYVDGLKAPRKGQIVWRTKYRAGVKFTI